MKNEKAIELAESVETANAKWLENNRAPARKMGEIDNRGGHFYFALYWAQAVAEQAKDEDLKKRFAKLAKELEHNEDRINEEFIGAQGPPQDIGGYYHPDPEKTERAMRPSATFNAILEAAGN
jgi:isocitrate dehydrogenase